MRDLTRKLADRSRRRPAEKRNRLHSYLRFERLEERALLAGFVYADFSDSEGLSLVQAASITADNRLRLTPAQGGQSGAAWYTMEKQFASVAFETTFQFQLSETQDAPGGSDGFTFAIQNHAPTYLAGGGGTLGYYDLPNSLVVEFDTFQNSEANDPSGSHISIHTNGVDRNSWLESLSLGNFNTNPIMDDGLVHTVRITYDSDTLSVYLDDLTVPKLEVNVDIGQLLDLDRGQAWVGFTAATGGGYQNHDILNWNYRVIADVATTVAIDSEAQVEGNSGTQDMTFTVTRFGDTTGTASLSWRTVDGSATAGSGDYVSATGIVTFDPGETTKLIPVTINGDTVIESQESFSIELSNLVGNGVIVDGIGSGKIIADDIEIRINDALIGEDDKTTSFLGNLVENGYGGLSAPRDMTDGPGGDLLVVDGIKNSVLRYDSSGSFKGEFVTSGSGGLINAWGLAFGPDGHLYVSGKDSIWRYDSSGQPDTQPFVSGATDGLASARAVVFDASGNLLVVDMNSRKVLRYQGPQGSQPGAFMNVFAVAGTTGFAKDAVFGPDGNLYVSVAGATPSTGYVSRHNGATGALIDQYVRSDGRLSDATNLAFDAAGRLYVADPANDIVFRFQGLQDPTPGALIDEFVKSYQAANGPIDPFALDFDANGNLRVSSSTERRIGVHGSGDQAAFTVSLNIESPVPVTVQYATANGSAAAPGDFGQVSGTLTFAPGQTTRTVLVKATNDSVGEPRESFSLNLTNAVKATIADPSGTGTIRDDDVTKFYVVDAGRDSTYEFADSGKSIETYGLNSTNSSPRGAASNIAGNKVWVVDSNRKVYVYDPSGKLLGSWSASSFKPSADLQGIATNGTDIWIVDNSVDRVFRHANAANLTSGKQNATSSFQLATSNKNPSDIVTDGTHLWVVDNAEVDKVFKYTLSGTLVSSWTIYVAPSSGQTEPTGITLDPANPAHLWIVDRSIDRVYEYTNAVNQPNGTTLAASASYALAANSLDPQGIADPPAPGTLQPAGGQPAMQSAQQSIDSDPAVNGSRAVAVDVAMLQAFAGSRPDANAAQTGQSVSVALSNAMRRSREAKVSSVASFAPTTAPQHNTYLDSAQNGRVAQQAIDELLTLWQPDLRPNHLLTRLS